MFRTQKSLRVFSMTGFLFGMSSMAFAAAEKAAPVSAPAPSGVQTAWHLVSSGGPVVIFLFILSIAAVASIIYHFKTANQEKLIPGDFTDNLLALLEKKEYQKAVSLCKQQENMISAITLKGLSKMSQGRPVVESAMQYEGKALIEKMWQNLTYLGDIAVVAPMLGLLGTILGMIDAFNFFKAGTIHPGLLTQGLAKAMINTALGLVVAVPCLIFYSFFRGRISAITSRAESAASEIVQAIAK